MSDFFDKDGSPIFGVLSWAEKFENEEYRRVKETTLPDGKWISTIWMGIDHSFDSGPRKIFETMVFETKEDRGDLLDCDRYSTEAEAFEGHKMMVAKWQEKKPH